MTFHNRYCDFTPSFSFMPLPSSRRQSAEAGGNRWRGAAGYRLVDRGTQCSPGPALPGFTAPNHDDDGCLPPGLGSVTPHGDGIGPLVVTGSRPTYQLSRARGGQASPRRLGPSLAGTQTDGVRRQHDSSGIYQPAGGTMTWPSTDIKARFQSLPYSGGDLFGGKFEALLKKEIRRQGGAYLPRPRRGLPRQFRPSKPWGSPPRRGCPCGGGKLLEFADRWASISPGAWIQNIVRTGWWMPTGPRIRVVSPPGVGGSCLPPPERS